MNYSPEALKLDRRGSILMISLWILAILAVFAVTVASRASFNLRLARFQRDSLISGLSAQSELSKAIKALNDDQNNYDALNETWSTGKDPDTGLDIFSNTVIIDEESLVSINGSGESDKKRLAALLNMLMVDDAPELAVLITDWKNTASVIPQAKKEDFKAQEEILAAIEYFYKTIRADIDYSSKAKDAYKKIKPFITASSKGNVNINTCAQESLKALIMEQEDPLSADSENLIQRIMQFRLSGQVFTSANAADIKVKLEEGGPFLSPEQINTLSEISTALNKNSENFRIEVKAVANRASSRITAVYNKVERKMVLWRQNL